MTTIQNPETLYVKDGRKFHAGDIVRHFKYETLNQHDKDDFIYLYKILGFAKHTETNENMVVYCCMYYPHLVYVRPANMFVSKVDHDKYPDIKQKYRFEVVNGEMIL